MNFDLLLENIESSLTILLLGIIAVRLKVI
jgi:hypothetical protein